MTTPAFTWTDRARPVIEIGVGDVRIDQDAGQWDVHHWDEPTAVWSGIEPVWQEVTCDAFSFTCEYGRQRTTDRFVAGLASIVVWNATGWADPNVTDDPSRLTMRPGRSIRVGVLHVVLGMRWLYRGFIDAMTPTYDPVQPDTVELSCIDALGEVNRAKVVPVDPPVGAGDNITTRLTRLLDAGSWPADKRALASASDTLIAHDLGGQLADLLGQAADSGGGNVYGDLNGNVAYKGRDWQIWVPGTPPDATIGNVEPGHLIPGSPQVDGYLNPTVGIASTPDAADLNITGDVRVTAKLRDDSAESATSRYVVLKGTSPSDLAYAALATFSTSLYGLLGWPTGASSPQLGSIVGLRTQWGMTPPGADVYVGVTAAGVVPGSQALTLAARGIRSTDGSAWSPYGPIPANIRADALSRDATGPLRLGSTVLGAAGGWQGRIYWVQLEAINRARLVFPGTGGNFLQIPSAADQQLPGDFEVVARVQAPPAGFPNATVVAKNGSWYLWLSPTNISTGFTLTPSGSTFPGSIAHGFAPGTIYWIKATRVAATGAVAFYTAPDSPYEPTTWVKLGADVIGTAGTIAFPAIPITVGVYSTFASPLRGRVLRVICRNGIGGSTYLDVSESNAGRMATSSTFVATTGQTVTVVQSNRFVFPGVVGNSMSMPDAAPLNITGDIEIVARIAPTAWSTGAQHGIVAKKAQTTAGYSINLNTNGGLLFVWTPQGGAETFVSATALTPLVDGQMLWVKVTRTVADGVVRFYYAPDNATTLEPTTWTKVGADVVSSAGTAIGVSTSPVYIGQLRASTWPFAGRISRVIVRSVIGGTIVADLAEHQSTVFPSTTVAAVGGTATAVQTAGNTIIQPDPTIAVVQPQPDAVVWRFDANDYPGAGTSYVDPRGRTWTLSAAGAIVPKVPAVPDVTVPADVCPVQWERPFARADLATRVIIGRDSDTAQVLDDPAGQLLYGIEPFERTDLLTANDDTITMLGQRVLRVRSAQAAPRIRSVTLDARTAENALDLMSSVDVYKPSRYRCRLLLDRGLVFDAEHLATGVAHDMTPSRWSLDLNLDLASPFAAAGGHWDGAYWDQALWSAAGA
jgi:hypothetical protein